ncbi:hypothetical protein ABVT39_012234 [Epinephelus coioides]
MVFTKPASSTPASSSSQQDTAQLSITSDLPQHAMVLDVRTRWNTLYLMIERFVEQYSAIQAASLDPRLRMSMERDRTPACGQILPILQKLEGHLKVQDADSTFTAAIKKRVWDDLSKRYTDENIRMFLEEATSLDPRFKTKILDAAVWSRLEEKPCGENSEQVCFILTLVTVLYYCTEMKMKY